MAECGQGHGKHMCQLVEKKTPTADLKKMVKDAKFICEGCGRAAAKKEHLCAPVAI